MVIGKISYSSSQIKVPSKPWTKATNSSLQARMM
jgi:hypothetical protein